MMPDAGTESTKGGRHRRIGLLSGSTRVRAATELPRQWASWSESGPAWCRLLGPVPIAVTAVLTMLGVLTVVPHPTLAGVLGLAIVGLCLEELVRIAIKGPFAPVSITFWAFVGVWVGFAPLLQIRDGHLPWADTPLTELFVEAQLILLVALVAFRVGYTRRPAAPSGTPARNWPRFALTPSVAIAVTGATAALAAVAIPRTGGLLVRFTTRDDLKQAMAEAGVTTGPDKALAGLLSTLPAAASLVALVMCLLCLRRHDGSRRSRNALFAATGVALVLNLTFNNPLTATRFATFSVALSVLLCLIDLRARSRRTLFAGSMVFGLLLVYPLANLFRNAKSRGELRLGVDAYYTFDFDGFQQTVNTVSYVDTIGHTWGHHTISALLFWTPRSLWTSKALPAGIPVAEARGYGFTNLAMPLWSEFYLEYSFVGVAVAMFCYGWLARRVDMVFQQWQAGAAQVLATIVAACQIGLLRGPTGAQLPFFATAMAIGVFGLLLVHRRRARSGAPPDSIRI
jgi:hypothetical protein